MSDDCIELFSDWTDVVVAPLTDDDSLGDRTVGRLPGVV